MEEKTKVFLREEKNWIEIRITGGDKPAIPDRVIANWQRIINTVARIMDVPAGLIMKITPDSMQVLLASQTEGNPYQPLASDALGHGLYCETVIGRNERLMVENALKNEVWKDNPDIKLNMISYLGMPIKWPDGEVFGTICVLDKKERTYNDDYLNLLYEFKNLIESDLERELRDSDLLKAESLAGLRLKELHHRIKNEFSIISALIQLKSSETSGDLQEVLDDLDAKLRSAALLHSRIYESSDFPASISGFIADVIKTSTDIYNSKINVEVHARQELEFDSKSMLDFGLVFSELVTNSIKNGIPAENGRITVDIDDIKEDGKDKYMIVYKDNGPGFSQDVLDGKGKEGIGTLIINIFLSKFDGSMKRYNSNGAVTEFKISRPRPESR